MHHTQRQKQGSMDNMERVYIEQGHKNCYKYNRKLFWVTNLRSLYAFGHSTDYTNINLDRQLIFNLDKVRQSMNLLTYCRPIRKWMY